MAKNPAVIIISALCVVGCVAAVTVGVTKWNSHSSGGGGGGGGGGDITASTKAVQSVCEPTRYREACVNSLGAAGNNTADPTELIKTAFRVAKEEITKAIEKSNTIESLKKDPRDADSLNSCNEMATYASNDLEKAVNSVQSFKMENMDAYLEDMSIRVGGAQSYLESCTEAFSNSSTDAGKKMNEILTMSKEITSNAVAIIASAKKVLTSLDIGGIMGGGRRLLEGKAEKGVWVAGVMPSWVDDPKRKMMTTPLGQIKADAVVAQDGSGQFKTITEALAKVPKHNESPFIIHVKAGTYKEYVMVEKHLSNVIMVGDGPTKTIVTGNKNFAAGVQTFKTATFAAMGDGFMARDMAFENTAGASGHQAVALRVVGDFSVFYNCRFDGYQDTLYTVRGRQFFRDCVITGTIDFIFGDAQAIFQKCEMRIRKPLDSQRCMVTAQGRTDPKGPGAFVLQGCRITGEADYMPVRTKMTAYLGRPWKEYSRTIIMNSDISEAIAPEGWTPWAGDFALDTLYYGEYQNKGAGANTAQRVKWGGIKNLTPQDAESFTPSKLFVTGDKWIPQSGVPYQGGMISA